MSDTEHDRGERGVDRGTHYSFFGGRIVLGEPALPPRGRCTPAHRDGNRPDALLPLPVRSLAGGCRQQLSRRHRAHRRRRAPLAGPDWRSLLASTAIIVTPCVVFFILVAPYLGRHVSWALVALSAVLVGFVLAMLATTALRDPGFYPRSPPSSDVEYG